MVTDYMDGDVEFCFFRRGAHEVFVCGDFNGWHPTSLPMASAGGGWWKYLLRLAPGSYQFKYRADGEWYLDYAAFGVERGPLGAWNSVVLVREEPRGAEPGRTPVTDATKSRRPLQGVSGFRAGPVRLSRTLTRSARAWLSASEKGCEPALCGTAVRPKE